MMVPIRPSSDQRAGDVADRRDPVRQLEPQDTGQGLAGVAVAAGDPDMKLAILLGPPVGPASSAFSSRDSIQTFCADKARPTRNRAKISLQMWVSSAARIWAIQPCSQAAPSSAKPVN